VSKYDLVDGRISSKISDEINTAIENCGKGDKHAHIARLGLDVPEFEMPKLYKACQCFVLPTRGEGFGLPFVEASLCGLPVIAPRHGGQMMFLSDDNSYLFDIDKIEELSIGKTNVHYWDGQKFPLLTSPQTIENIGKLMRLVKDEYHVAKEKNKKLQQRATNFSLEKVGSLAAERLSEIWQTL